MKIEELQREFIIKINDAERKQLLEALKQHRSSLQINVLCKLLEGMEIL